MVKNLQCPVCTLFLHAGINLCDHLETHPKEQVINALVQLTILGNDQRPSSLIEPPEEECRENVLEKGIVESNGTTRQSATPIKDHDLSSNSSHSVSIGSLSNQSSINTQTSLNNAISFGGESNATDGCSNFSANSQRVGALKSVVNANANVEKVAGSTANSTATTTTVTSAAATTTTIQNYQTKTSTALPYVPTDFTIFSSQRYQHTVQPPSISVSNSSTQLLSLLHQNQCQEYLRSNMSAAALPNQQSNALMADAMPGQIAFQHIHHKQQAQVQNELAILTPPLPLQLTLPPPMHPSTHRQAQLYPSHHPHLQQNLLQHQQQQNMFPAELPPPPPLQLFTYQPSIAPQHQKPPPAYGTAISQIRSQSKHQKHHASALSHLNQAHQSSSLIQATAVKQQVPLHPNSSSPHTFQQRSTFPLHQSLLHTPINSIMHQQQNPSNKKSLVATNMELKNVPTPPPPAPPAPQPSAALHNRELLQPQSKNCTDVQTRTPNTTNAVAHETHFKNRRNLSNVSVKTLNTQLSNSSIHGSGSSTPVRHTNSPYPVLLAAVTSTPTTTSASSTTSVLRFAESPVAHYLERENGDFIVQETPKHIMEYVEKEDGEFSVIERIYQSPPSVLHIHDGNDDDEEDDNVPHNSTISSSKGDSIIPLNGTKVSSDLSTEGHNFSDIEDDFMSISGESDQEEFLTNSQQSQAQPQSQAQIQQQQKNKNENLQIVAKQAEQTMAAVEEAQSHLLMPSTSKFTPGSSATSNATATIRKKSSKNTITVLSDVQLNLSEYLDLVGNIIASSKRKTSTTTALAPIPLVKIEKEEPPDDYETRLQLLNEEVESSSETKPFPSPTSTPSQANKHETDDNVTVTAKMRTNVGKTDEMEKKPDVSDICSHTEKAGTSHSTNYTGHATSVIRMASTANPNKKIHQHQHHHFNYIDATKTSTGGIRHDGEWKHDANNNSGEAEDLSKPPTKSKQYGNAAATPDYTGKHYSSIPIARKGPKKLIIKPKSLTKTETTVMSNSKGCNAVLYGDDQKPSTSAKAKEEYNKLKQRTSQQNQPSDNNQSVQKFSSAESRSRPDKEMLWNETEKAKGFNYITLLNGNQSHEAEDKYKFAEASNVRHKDSQDIYKIPSESDRVIHGDVQRNCEKYPQSKVKLTISPERDDKLQERRRPSTMVENIMKIKSEPLSLVNYDNLPGVHENVVTQQMQGPAADVVMVCKEEKPCLTEACVTAQIMTHMKTESNINEDARVLYNFANSRKVSLTDVAANNFAPSPPSTSSKKEQLISKANNNTPTSSSSCNTESSVASSHIDLDVYSSHSASEATFTQSFEHSDDGGIGGGLQQSATPNFIDYPFSFLYNSNHITSPQHVDIKCSQTFYHNANNNISAANNVNIDGVSIKKSTLSRNVLTSSEWFHNTDPNSATTSTSNTTLPTPTGNVAVDFNSSLSVDCNASLDGSDVSKYLDLDACKREQKFDMSSYMESQQVPMDLPPSSPNSCSFTGGNADNSLVGACSTAATLNIRTDEKMPAKGEISEQESNCDIDNSWSQPMYGDISARFFKTSFPGMFTHDSGWHHDDCFTAQDLSASTTTQAAAAANGSNRARSFDLRLPMDTTTTTSEHFNISTQQVFPLNSQDVLPSTSMKTKKRRKRGSQDEKMTVLVPQVLNQQQRDRGVDVSDLEQVPASVAISSFLPDPTNLAGIPCPTFVQSSSPPEHKTREKTYECARCFAKYTKLKDRNAHMIDVHKYVRQNRKLVCPQSLITSTVTSNEVNAAEMASSTSVCPLIVGQHLHSDQLEDSKHGIIKMETEPLEHVEATLDFVAKVPKELDMDDKRSLIIPMANAPDARVMQQPDQKDIKFNGLNRLGFNAPTPKLTTLYRMLVTYNMNNLKMKQEVTEMDEKLMESLIFYCHLCRQSFSSVKLYDIHLTEHPAECFSCGKKFQRWKNLSLHLKRHMGWKEFGCNVCEKKFVVRSALVEHMRMHSGHSPLKCKICGKHFKRYSNLTQHRKRHSKQVIRKKEYVCYCGEVLPSKARFLWHKETHDSKPKCCPHCCDRFIHINSLKRHIRLAHSDKFDYVEPMECPICKQVFAKASMKSHMATHSTDSQYDCTICNKSFSTKWNLKIHSWVHANRTSKPFKCDHCPKAFVREIDFKNHINSHKQIRPYTCEVCGCKFIRKYNYMRHRREHHGDKKFTCDLCKKSFHRHYYLIEHRRIHTGERPFQCTICGKSSTTKTNHNKHMKIHHSRDPFTVEV